MNGDEWTDAPEPEVERLAAQPLDDDDVALLAQLRTVLEEADPAPTDLVERVRFALALEEVFSEVARITRVGTDALAVRSEPTAQVRTETLTFSAERLTAMVTVTGTVSGARMDGWVAPDAPVRVLLRRQDGGETETETETGRFVFEGVEEGFVQLVFQPVGTIGAEADDVIVVTPLFQV